MRQDLQWGGQRSAGLVDVLDRVLDKGLVIAGDIKIALADVELLAIRIRLIVCSLDKAQEVGIDWWKYDQHLSAGKPLNAENEALREQVKALEHRVAELTANAAMGRGLMGAQGSGGAVAEAAPRRPARAEAAAGPGGKPTGHE
jgi:hypothetical protein